MRYIANWYVQKIVSGSFYNDFHIMTKEIEQEIEKIQQVFGDTIEKDFLNYKGNRISFEDVDSLISGGYYIKISIHNNNLYYSSDSSIKNKTKQLFVHLESILKNADLHGLKFPNVSFIYSLDTVGMINEPDKIKKSEVPFFVLCNSNECNLGIRVPNMYFENVFLNQRKMVLKRNIASFFKFRNRINKIYYRGGASGRGSLPRIKLASTFETNDNFDVGLVSKPRISEDITQSLIEQYPIKVKKHLPNLTNTFYKFSIHMPGSSVPKGYSFGLQELLNWGCCVLFWDETCYEWYYDTLLREGVVYKTKLEDIESLSLRLQKDTETAEKKAKASQEFAQNYFSKDALTAFWYLTMKKYSSIYLQGDQYYQETPNFKPSNLDFDYIHLKFSLFLLKCRLKPLVYLLNGIVININNFSRKLKGR